MSESQSTGSTSWADATEATSIQSVKADLEKQTNNNNNSNSNNPQAVNEITENLKNTSVNDENDEAESTIASGLNPNDSTAQVDIVGLTEKESVYNSKAAFTDFGLKPELLKGVTELKYTQPSRIQAAAIPIILLPERKNLMAQAHAGSGKTAAFALGILNQIDEKRDSPQAIIVSPTRELSNQNAMVFEALAKFTKIKITSVGVSGPGQQNREQIRGHVIVGTPGTLIGLLDRKQLNSRDIKILVCDEADELVGEGMGEQTVRIRNKVPKAQILLFSATFSEHIKKFAKSFVGNEAVELLVKTELLALASVKQFVLNCKDYEDKYNNLKAIYALLEIGQSIIFVQTVAMAKKLTNSMRKDNFAVSLLHGKDMSVQDRDTVVKEFKEEKTTVLIATNLIARGLDVPTVTMVVNFEVPLTRRGTPDFESYIHRINRAGRFGRKGAAITMVDSDSSRRVIAQIEDHYKSQCQRLPEGNIEQISDIIKAVIE